MENATGRPAFGERRLDRLGQDRTFRTESSYCKPALAPFSGGLYRGHGLLATALRPLLLRDVLVAHAFVQTNPEPIRFLTWESETAPTSPSIGSPAQSNDDSQLGGYRLARFATTLAESRANTASPRTLAHRLGACTSSLRSTPPCRGQDVLGTVHAPQPVSEVVSADVRLVRTGGRAC